MTRRAVLIESLQSTPRDLARLLRPIDDVAGRWRPSPGEWCIADVVAHLSYCEEPYLARLRRVVAQDNPFEPYLHPDESAHDLTRSLADLLEAFVARRAETVAFLSGLGQRDWGRPLVHETIGPTRLRDQVQELVAHDNVHLEQVVALRERLEAGG
ncbi:MAG TPA: DinB family protein [Roseiflexaceae bacterium]|nr:DinB family protein [Roseiflexaceae bacterium]